MKLPEFGSNPSDILRLELTSFKFGLLKGLVAVPDNHLCRTGGATHGTGYR